MSKIADALIKLKVASGGYLAGIESHSPKNAVDICGPAFTVEVSGRWDRIDDNKFIRTRISTLILLLHLKIIPDGITTRHFSAQT